MLQPSRRSFSVSVLYNIVTSSASSIFLLLWCLNSMTSVVVDASAIGSPPMAARQNLCKETKHGVDGGLVRVPDFQDLATAAMPFNVTCSWSYTAQKGKKLLVKVDSVHLPPSNLRESTLKLILDEQVIDIPRNCVRSCLKQIVSGHSVQIVYTSIALLPASDSTNTDDLVEDDEQTLLLSDIGSFQIRYKSFDPTLCDKPKQPLNGFVTIVGRKLGQEIQYHCNPPYDLYGKANALCQIPSDSPVPEWSYGVPKCLVSNCTSTPLVRQAGSGAIASPGYPGYIIDYPLTCEWFIVAKKGYQIESTITFLEVNNQDGRLSLYDGQEKIETQLLADFNSSIDSLRKFTTKSNSLTVSFRTINTTSQESGFYLQYSALPGACKEPTVPENGEVIGYSFGVGSTIAFRCWNGYVLEGNSTSECLLDGTWSGVLPTCLWSNVSVNSLETALMETEVIISSNPSEEIGLLSDQNVPLPTTIQPETLLISTTKDVNLNGLINSESTETGHLTSENGPVSNITTMDNFTIRPTESGLLLNSSISTIFTTVSPPTLASVVETVTDSDLLEGIPSKVPKSSKKHRLYLTSKIPLKSTLKPKDKANGNDLDNGGSTINSEEDDASSFTPSITISDVTTEMPLVAVVKTTANKTEIAEDHESSSNGFSPKEKSMKLPPAQSPVRVPKIHISSGGGPNDLPSLSKEMGPDDSVHPPSPRPAGGKQGHKKPPSDEEVSSLVMYTIIGSSVGALLLIIAVVATLVVYRKKFPVRMRFGRKFSTFENPMYAAAGSKDRDAQHPRELKRLTTEKDLA